MSAKKAFSYARFSTSEQLEGRSLKRQEEACKAYCTRHGLTLDERTFTDLGVSGYKGGNARGGQLADFLELVREGRIPKGSTLIVENMDRLSRLPPHEANEIIMAIVKAGVNIATTNPEQLYTLANIKRVETWIPLQVAQCLASGESEKKSERLQDAWAAKRDDLAKGIKMSKHGPAWLQITADRKGWGILEEKAAMVRRAFALALEGRGAKKIAEVLNQEYPDGLAGGGRGWEPSYICCLLRSRSVIGEYQPYVGTCAKKGGIPSTRKPVGDPIKDYFPAIVAEADFHRAQDALDQRRRSGGRTVGTPNLFNGLLTNALDGWKMVLNSSHGRKVLLSAGAVRRMPGCAFRTVDYRRFETAILSLLAELTPADVIGKPGQETDQVAVWSGKLTVINRNLAAMQKQAAVAEDASAFIPIISDLARQKKEASAELEKAQAANASREGDTLGEMQSLLRLLEDCEGVECDELRRKVRAALRRLLSEMWCLIVARGRTRLIAVQIWFAEGKRQRSYLIRMTPGTNHAAGRTETVSFASVAQAGDLDLRQRAAAARLEALLASLDTSSLGDEE